jgi:hypothetical protein
LKVTPRCIHHRGVDLEGLREVNLLYDCSFKFKGHDKSLQQLKTVKRLSVVNTPWSLDSSVVNTPGSSDYPVVNTPGSRIFDSPAMNSVHLGGEYILF